MCLEFQDDYDDTNTDVTLPSMPMYSNSRGRPPPATPQPTLQMNHHMQQNNPNLMQPHHMHGGQIPPGPSYMQHPHPHQGHGMNHPPPPQSHHQGDSAIDRMSSMLSALDTDVKYRNQQ